MITKQGGRLCASSTALLVALGLSAASCTDEPELEEPAADAAALEEVDGDWIRLNGTVVFTAGSRFRLDYGEGAITVEVDDWDFGKEGESLLRGDRVGVTGRVDENVFTSDTIEAAAVYLHKFDVVYYANSADEEEFGLGAVPIRPEAEGVDYVGWVTGTSEDGFTLGAGPTRISVDTSEVDTALAQDRINTGDRVYVWGELDVSGEGSSRLEAEGLVQLVSSYPQDRPSSGASENAAAIE